MRIQNLYITIICFCVFILTACASGSAIVTGTTRDPIDPSQVTLYLEPPEAYESIGIVKASSDAGWTEQGLSLIHISEPTRPVGISRMPSSA